MDSSDALDTRQRYISAYEVTRHYGGPEEGGWWYDWYELVDTVPCEAQYVEQIREGMKAKHDHRVEGDISSVLGGTAVSIMTEDEPGEFRSTERPFYE